MSTLETLYTAARTALLAAGASEDAAAQGAERARVSEERALSGRYGHAVHPVVGAVRVTRKCEMTDTSTYAAYYADLDVPEQIVPLHSAGSGRVYAAFRGVVTSAWWDGRAKVGDDLSTVRQWDLSMVQRGDGSDYGRQDGSLYAFTLL